MSLAHQISDSDSDSDQTIDFDGTASATSFKNQSQHIRNKDLNNKKIGDQKDNLLTETIISHDLSDSDVTIDPNDEQLSPNLISSSDQEEMPPKKSKKSTKSEPYRFKKTNSSVHSVSDSDSDEEIKTSKIRGKTVPSGGLKRKQDTALLDESPKAGTSKDVTDTRPVCEYGKDCYRKNPSHLREYSHTAGRQSDRENLSHLREYSHTAGRQSDRKTCHI